MDETETTQVSEILCKRLAAMLEVSETELTCLSTQCPQQWPVEFQAKVAKFVAEITRN